MYNKACNQQCTKRGRIYLCGHFGTTWQFRWRRERPGHSTHCRRPTSLAQSPHFRATLQWRYLGVTRVLYSRGTYAKDWALVLQRRQGQIGAVASKSRGRVGGKLRGGHCRVWTRSKQCISGRMSGASPHVGVHAIQFRGFYWVPIQWFRTCLKSKDCSSRLFGGSLDVQRQFTRAAMPIESNGAIMLTPWFRRILMCVMVHFLLELLFALRGKPSGMLVSSNHAAGVAVSE